MTENKMMGRRYDGGQSPLGGDTYISGDLATALMVGKDKDRIILPDAKWEAMLGELRVIIPKILGVSIEEFSRWSHSRQDEGVRRLRRVIERRMRAEKPGLLEKFEHQYRCRTASVERERIHREILRPWALGPLVMEHPQGSSLRHLLDYDREHCPGKFEMILSEHDDTQDIVVENDWARVVPASIAGEWRLPFAHCVWEFRISGIRIVAFTEADDEENPFMFLVYGADGHWVSDDYRYFVSGDDLRSQCNYTLGVSVEFRRAAQLVRDQIRASCIMLDAGVCERRREAASPVLVQRARREGRVPPRDHEVVRLLREDHRTYRAHSAGTSGFGSRAPQRGHWRRGTWVHYDDQDSGQEQYANSGGFFVSRTWRRWHFAGDPRNIIEREYRL